MKRLTFFLLLLASPLSAATMRNIRDSGLSDESAAAINLNFLDIQNELLSTVHKSSTETIRGFKTFSDTTTIANLTLSGMTAGSIPYIGTAGVLSQNNTALYWNNTNVRLGIGNGAPSTQLHMTASAASTAGLLMSVTGSKGYALAFGASLPSWVDATAPNGRIDSVGNFVFNSGNGASADLYFNYDSNRNIITGTGRVGIGVTAPDIQLHLTGASAAASGIKYTVTGSKGYALCWGASVPSWVDATGPNGRIDTAGDFVFDSGTGGDLYFNYDNRTTRTNYFDGVNEFNSFDTSKASNFRTMTATNGTITTITGTTATITNLVGTTTNNNATAGSYGQYVSSGVTTLSDFAASGQWWDAASISLTAGDWDVSSVMYSPASAASFTDMALGVSSTAGNSSPTAGDSYVSAVFPINASRNGGGALGPVRFSLATTTTVYLKFYGVYTAATPQAQGRISARRVR